jgi:anti-sigma B factor antagonist
MELTVTHAGEVAIVRLALEKLDLSTSGEFKRVITPVVQSNKLVVLDMEDTNFVDSSGLGAILSVLRGLSAAGGDLRLCHVQKRVRVMFEMVRMHRILGIYDTPEDAVRSFAGAAAPAD